MTLIENIIGFLQTSLSSVGNLINWLLGTPLTVIASLIVYVGLPLLIVVCGLSLYEGYDLSRQRKAVRSLLKDADEA